MPFLHRFRGQISHLSYDWLNSLLSSMPYILPEHSTLLPGWTTLNWDFSLISVDILTFPYKYIFIFIYIFFISQNMRATYLLGLHQEDRGQVSVPSSRKRNLICISSILHIPEKYWKNSDYWALMWLGNIILFPFILVLCVWFLKQTNQHT